jgi:hypothetical protein
VLWPHHFFSFGIRNWWMTINWWRWRCLRCVLKSIEWTSMWDHIGDLIWWWWIHGGGSSQGS